MQNANAITRARLPRARSPASLTRRARPRLRSPHFSFRLSPHPNPQSRRGATARRGGSFCGGLYCELARVGLPLWGLSAHSHSSLFHGSLIASRKLYEKESSCLRRGACRAARAGRAPRVCLASLVLPPPASRLGSSSVAEFAAITRRGRRNQCEGGKSPPRSLRSLPLCSDEIQWRSIQSARAARRARPFTRNPSIPASPPPSPPPYPPPLLRGEGEKIQIYYPQVYPLFAFDALAYFADYKEMTSRDNSASGHKSTLELDPTRPMSDHAR